MAELDVLQVCVETIKADITEMKGEIKEANKQARLTYLTLVQYEAEVKPMRAIVYGLVGLILTLVISAGVYLLINRGGTP